MACLETLADEGFIIYKSKSSREALDYLCHLSDFNNSLVEWFYKKEKTEKLMEKIFEFNKYFLAFEALTQEKEKISNQNIIIMRMKKGKMIIILNFKKIDHCRTNFTLSSLKTNK